MKNINIKKCTFLYFNRHNTSHTWTQSCGGSFFSDFISTTAMLGFTTFGCALGDCGGTDTLTITGCGLVRVTDEGKAAVVPIRGFPEIRVINYI